jgi:taurine dioxygenase
MTTLATQPTFRHLTGSIGTEVLGIDVRSLDDAQFEDLREAFTDRCVLVLRGQHLGAQDLVDFSKRWGELFVIPYGPAIDGFPEVRPITNVGKANTVTEAWHSDATFMEEPAAHGILAAQALPPAGGDTIFANQYAAYESLSESLKALLDGMRAIHEDHVLGKLQGLSPSEMPSSSHPVVRTQVDSGRKSLFVNPLYTTRFEGMTAAESAGLLAYLYQHAVSPEFCYRHRWQDGDVVMWDNRCTLHYAVHDHGDAERVLFRTTIAGGVPR